MTPDPERDSARTHDSYEALYRDYVAELEGLVPMLRAWKASLEAKRGAEENAQVWWTGPGGHPRVLEVYRRYYFAIEQLNVDRDAAFSWTEPPPEEERWGTDASEPGPGTRRHNDLLLRDAGAESPALRELVEGIVFVPVGLDAEDLPV